MSFEDCVKFLAWLISVIKSLLILEVIKLFKFKNLKYFCGKKDALDSLIFFLLSSCLVTIMDYFFKKNILHDYTLSNFVNNNFSFHEIILKTIIPRKFQIFKIKINFFTFVKLPPYLPCVLCVECWFFRNSRVKF